MKAWSALLMALLLLLSLGCGGGGGGGTGITVTGRVLNVVTTGAPTPAVTVTAGSQSVTTAADGSFAIQLARGATQVRVDGGSGIGLFTYTFPAVNAPTDLGDLWIGPQRVTVRGTVRNALSGDVIPDATVLFAGRIAQTDAAGGYVLTDVAYAAAAPAGFQSLEGLVRKTGFLSSPLRAVDRLPVGGEVTLEDVLMVPSTDSDPPPTPYNLWGRVLPGTTAAGSVVTLREAGIPVRTANVGTDGRYFFWVEAGTYTVQATKGATSGPVVTVTVTDPATVIQRDISSE